MYIEFMNIENIYIDTSMQNSRLLMVFIRVPLPSHSKFVKVSKSGLSFF